VGGDRATGLHRKRRPSRTRAVLWSSWLQLSAPRLRQGLASDQHFGARPTMRSVTKIGPALMPEPGRSFAIGHCLWSGTGGDHDTMAACLFVFQRDCPRVLSDARVAREDGT
jgi:hypothetical protein